MGVNIAIPSTTVAVAAQEAAVARGPQSWEAAGEAPRSVEVREEEAPKSAGEPGEASPRPRPAQVQERRESAGRARRVPAVHLPDCFLAPSHRPVRRRRAGRTRTRSGAPSCTRRPSEAGVAAPRPLGQPPPERSADSWGQHGGSRPDGSDRCRRRPARRVGGKDGDDGQAHRGAQARVRMRLAPALCIRFRWVDRRHRFPRGANGDGSGRRALGACAGGAECRQPTPSESVRPS